MAYATEVGERLRRIRQERGWSLHDVERRSRGVWKAAVVGSYERGDRNISADRLCRLAEFYGVAATEVLPPDDSMRTSSSSEGLVIDLERIAGDRWHGLRRYCETIQVQRGDYNGRLLSIRGEDVRALAIIMDTTSDVLLEELRADGILTED